MNTVTDLPFNRLLNLQAAGLASKGRGLISVNVELHDDSCAHVLSATVEWFIANSKDAN
jgi:hypothetical protein